MEWYVPVGDRTTASALRREIKEHLKRHADTRKGIVEAEVVVAELIANAVEHTDGPAWVSLRWDTEQPVLTVTDLGPGFVPDTALPTDRLAYGGRGLYLADLLTDELRVAARAVGGSVVRAVLPVQRRREPDIAPPRRPTAALPGQDEALPGGGFGREAFLRALVVQLAQAVEAQQGPDAAAAAVAQVGTDVGAQMELEYRTATGLVDRLTPAQLGHAYVRLKAAIGGDFRVVEADERRVVLVNTACPFGDVVQRAPSLCRMTSSVFGGMAAGASPAGAAVLLEERIALGDHHCRVVVWLSPDSPEVPTTAQRYPPPE